MRNIILIIILSITGCEQAPMFNLKVNTGRKGFTITNIGNALSQLKGYYSMENTDARSSSLVT